MLKKGLLILLCGLMLTATACTAKPVETPQESAAAAPVESVQPESTPAPEASPENSEEPASTFDVTRVSDLLLQTENFSVTLMQNLKTGYTDRNTLFSPLSLNASLAALYAAAGGDTEEELRVMMGYQTEPKDTVETLAYLLSTIDSDRFTLGGSLHLTKRVGFSESFINDVTTPLRISTYSQDYADQVTFKSINACAEVLTDGRVSDVLASTSAADTLYLLAGFAASGDFDLPFDPAQSVSSSFTTPTGIVKTTMMNGQFQLPYAEDEYCQTVGLPMSNGTMMLQLVLPRLDGEAAFDEAMIQYADSWLSTDTLKEEYVDLSLPKFTISDGGSYTEILSSMGLSSALRAQSVDLSGMLNPDLLLPTPLNDIFTVGSLTIAENGVNSATEAVPEAAQTSEESIQVVFDRPFLMALTDTQSGAILAMGWVNTVNENK